MNIFNNAVSIITYSIPLMVQWIFKPFSWVYKFAMRFLVNKKNVRATGVISTRGIPIVTRLSGALSSPVIYQIPLPISNGGIAACFLPRASTLTLFVVHIIIIFSRGTPQLSRGLPSIRRLIHLTCEYFFAS